MCYCSAHWVTLSRGCWYSAPQHSGSLYMMPVVIGEREGIAGVIRNGRQSQSSKKMTY